jgi:plastocyanin
VIVIEGIYSPSILKVSVGTTVTWTSADWMEPDRPQLYTVTSDIGLFDSLLWPGDSYSYTFTEPGTYTYHNKHDARMTGAIIVK